MYPSTAPCSANLLSSGNDASCLKRLCRPRTNRLPGRICGGRSNYVDADANLIRILRVALTLLSIGVGVIACIVAWILIPEEPEARDVASALY
jgi:phage shock protein PspC (stress-responsive transcriptional regulator)